MSHASPEIRRNDQFQIDGATLKIQIVGFLPKVNLNIVAAPFLVECKINRQEMNFNLMASVAALSMVPRAVSLLSHVIPTACVPAQSGVCADLRRLGFPFPPLTFANG